MIVLDCFHDGNDKYVGAVILRDNTSTYIVQTEEQNQFLLTAENIIDNLIRFDGGGLTEGLYNFISSVAEYDDTTMDVWSNYEGQVVQYVF